MNVRRHGSWACIAIAAMAMASTAAAGGEIRIWPTATVTGESVQLRDIAQLRGFDAESAQRMTHLVVHAAPTTGGEIHVRPDDIRTALTEAGEDLSSVNLVGSARCKVSKPLPPRPPKPKTTKPKPRTKVAVVRPIRSKPSAAPQPVVAQSRPPGTLESAIRDYIIASFPQRDVKLEIRFSPAKEDVLQIAGPGVKFDVLARDEKKLGLRSFEIIVHRPDEEDQRIPIVGEVTLIEEVVLARRAINRGETIEGRALKLEERRFTDLATVGLTDLSAAIGQQCRAFLRPGEMITVDSIEQRPVVLRGQPVTIWMRQGSLAIRTTGKVQQSGALGDRIEVLRDGAKRKQDLIEAVVTGPGTVSIGEPDQVALR